jgi:hypothetical protein
VSPPPAHAGTSGPERLERLRHDRALLAEHYPALTFEIDEARATAEAAGPLRVELPDGTSVTIEVRIEFGHSYPYRPPRAYDAARRWEPESDRHIEHDSHFCLFLRAVDAPDMKPDEAILDLMRELEVFLRQQVVLDSQRRFNPDARFPGPEWPHGYLAFELFVVRLLEQEPVDARAALWDAARHSLNRRSACPCGSGDSYGDCHFKLSKKLRRSAREANLYTLTYERLVQDTQAYA